MTAKLFIATPCYGGMVHCGYTYSLLETCAYLQAHGIPSMVGFQPGDSHIIRARNVLVAKFMLTDCTHMLFVDGDQKWPPEAIARMLAASSEFDDLPVVCASVPKKRLPIEFVANFPGDAGGKLILHEQTGYIEVRDAGTGLLLIRRDAFMRLMDAYPQRQCSFRDETDDDLSVFEYLLFDSFIDRNRKYLSEDYGFSRLWQSIGGRVWLDPDIEVTHYGAHDFTGKILDSLIGKAEEKETVCPL